MLTHPFRLHGLRHFMGLRSPLVHDNDLRQRNYKRRDGTQPYISKSPDRATAHEADGRAEVSCDGQPRPARRQISPRLHGC